MLHDESMLAALSSYPRPVRNLRITKSHVPSSNADFPTLEMDLVPALCSIVETFWPSLRHLDLGRITCKPGFLRLACDRMPSLELLAVDLQSFDDDDTPFAVSFPVLHAIRITSERDFDYVEWDVPRLQNISFSDYQYREERSQPSPLIFPRKLTRFMYESESSHPFVQQALGYSASSLEVTIMDFRVWSAMATFSGCLSVLK